MLSSEFCQKAPNSSSRHTGIASRYVLWSFLADIEHFEVLNCLILIEISCWGSAGCGVDEELGFGSMYIHSKAHLSALEVIRSV